MAMQLSLLNASFNLFLNAIFLMPSAKVRVCFFLQPLKKFNQAKVRINIKAQNGEVTVALQPNQGERKKWEAFIEAI